MDSAEREELRDELMALVFAAEGDFESCREELRTLVRRATREGVDLREDVNAISSMPGWAEFVDSLFETLD